MITSIATVTVFVEDQERARAFYTDKLGFALINDAEMFPGAGMRWITVAPPGCATELSLFPDGRAVGALPRGDGQAAVLHAALRRSYGDLSRVEREGRAVSGRAASPALGQFRRAGRFRGLSDRSGAAGLGDCAGDLIGRPYQSWPYRRWATHRVAPTDICIETGGRHIGSPLYRLSEMGEET